MTVLNQCIKWMLTRPNIVGWTFLIVIVWAFLSWNVLIGYSSDSVILALQIGFPFFAALLFYCHLTKMMWSSKSALIGISLVMFWIFIAILLPVLPLHDPNQPLKAFVKPLGTNEDYWLILGTDHKGRDLLSRTLWGCQRVLIWGISATLVAYAVGIFFGLLAGYKSGWWDEVSSFVVNILLSFPTMILFVLILYYFSVDGLNIIVAVIIASSPAIMRIVRSLTYEIKHREHVLAARLRHESTWYILFVEILPNIRIPLIVDACLRLGYTTVTITTLTFLGLGLQPPDPDWGLMIKETRNIALTQTFSYMILIPAISVSSLVLGFNLFADGWQAWKQENE